MRVQTYLSHVGSNASSGTDVVDTEGNSTTVTTTATTPATVITTASTPSSTGTIRELNLSGMTRERAVNQGTIYLYTVV